MDQYFADAKAFITATGFYQSMRLDSALAVAEYMAYKDGFTVRDWKKQ